ncbi:hypothetical protein AMECASPLE_016580 [Ameca splendens]|uniref:Uncharacterized protein n=1 Tax=Ameca splendens TaxID=208324 RepID=A0ABV1A8M5_9TELE
MFDPTQPNWTNTTFYLRHFRLFTSVILVHALLTGENLNNVKTNLISPFQLRNCKIMSKLHDWEVLTHTHIYIHADISISRSKSTLVKVCLFLKMDIQQEDMLALPAASQNKMIIFLR